MKKNLNFDPLSIFDQKKSSNDDNEEDNNWKTRYKV